MKQLKWSNVFKILMYFISFMFGFRKLKFPKDATMKEINYATLFFILIFALLMMCFCVYMFNLIFK